MAYALRAVAPREPRAQTRKRVLEAAASAFAKNGIDATSLEAIATSAGLTKGAIFSNFRSKDELVFAVADEFKTDIDLSMFLDLTLSFEEQFRELGRAAARALKGANRRQVLLDRALQTYILKHPAARTRQRKRLTEATKAAGAGLESLAQHRAVKLPLPGTQLVHVLNALARGLTESALQDPTLLDEEYFAEAFGVLARSIEPLGA